MKRWLIGAVLAAVLAVQPARADEKKFEATAFEYNVNNSPQITTKKFVSRISIFEQQVVKIVEIKNFISQKSSPDVVVKIAASSDSVASIIYNEKMEVIAEYPRGTQVNSNLAVFKGGDAKRRLSGSWYIDPDYLMSDFSIMDEAGTLLYKETVIYTSKSPSR